MFKNFPKSGFCLLINPGTLNQPRSTASSDTVFLSVKYQPVGHEPVPKKTSPFGEIFNLTTALFNGYDGDDPSFDILVANPGLSSMLLNSCTSFLGECLPGSR